MIISGYAQVGFSSHKGLRATARDRALRTGYAAVVQGPLLAGWLPANCCSNAVRLGIAASKQCNSQYLAIIKLSALTDGGYSATLKPCQVADVSTAVVVYQKACGSTLSIAKTTAVSMRTNGESANFTRDGY